MTESQKERLAQAACQAWYKREWVGEEFSVMWEDEKDDWLGVVDAVLEESQ